MSLPEYLRYTVYGQKVKRAYGLHQSAPQWVQNSMIYHSGLPKQADSSHITPIPQPFSVDDSISLSDFSLPTAWKIDDTSEHRIISREGMVSVSTEVNENREIRFMGNNCIPKSCGIWYYEITLDPMCNSSLPIMFGLTREVPHRQIGNRGTQGYCWLYFSDDGRIMPDKGSARKYGPKFGPGDTIGCGINFSDNSIFYTKNGIDIGVAFRRVNASSLYAFLSAHAGAIIHTNFGAQDFKFDIVAYVQTQKQHFYTSVDAVPLNMALPTGPDATSGDKKLVSLIENYMASMGYTQSLKALQKTSKQSTLSTDSILIREKVRLAILNHEFGAVTSLLVDWPIPRDLLFELDCQKMATAVRNEDIAEALAIGKNLKLRYGHISEYQEPLTLVYATLAYPRSAGGAPWERELYGPEALKELVFKIMSVMSKHERVGEIELPFLLERTFEQVEDCSEVNANASLINIFSDVFESG